MQKFEVYMNGVFLESFALDVRDCKHFFFYFLSKINQYMRRAEEIKAFLKVYNALCVVYAADEYCGAKCLLESFNI